LYHIPPYRQSRHMIMQLQQLLEWKKFARSKIAGRN
jgi:hypothetical protein